MKPVWGTSPGQARGLYEVIQPVRRVALTEIGKDVWVGRLIEFEYLAFEGSAGPPDRDTLKMAEKTALKLSGGECWRQSDPESCLFSSSRSQVPEHFSNRSAQSALFSTSSIFVPTDRLPVVWVMVLHHHEIRQSALFTQTGKCAATFRKFSTKSCIFLQHGVQGIVQENCSHLRKHTTKSWW